MKIRNLILALFVTGTLGAVKKQRLHSTEVSYESIRGHAESYGSSEKFVVVVLLNGSEKDAEVTGAVNAMNSAKNYSVATCAFKTRVAAGSEAKIKVRCAVSAADELQLVIQPAQQRP